MAKIGDEGAGGLAHNVAPPDEAIGEEVTLFPLTPHQIALWRKAKEEPTLSNYNGAFRFALDGPIRVVLLEHALAALVRRHEIVRACVIEVDGAPKLAIHGDASLRLAISDLRLLSKEAAEARAEELCKIEACRPFNLSQAPLMRVGLILIDDTQAILTFTVHHIACDGWSLSAIIREVTADYDRLFKGEQTAEAAPALQFGDYSTWLDGALGDGSLDGQLDAWRQRLKGYRRFDVPGNIDVDHIAESDSDIVGRPVDTALVTAFERQVKAAGGTLFTGVLAALSVVLGTAAARDDVSVGVPVAGRNQPELEGVIGPLVNYVVLGAELSGSDTFRSLEQKIRHKTFDALSTQTVPLEAIADDLRQSMDAFPDPVFSICFVSQVAFGGSDPASRFADCGLQTLPSVSPGAIYDLFFFLVQRESGYRLSVEFRTKRYSAAFASEMLNAIEQIMRTTSHGLDERIDALRPSLSTVPVAATAASDDGEGAYVFPASAVQERYWLLSQSDQAGSTHNVPIAVRINGKLDHAALRAALRAVVTRHETLRTVFRSIDGVLQQVVFADRSSELALSDLTSTPREQAERDLARLIAEDASKPFDLANDPLLRVRLYQLSANEHVLAQTYHHIICDGQSVSIVQRDLWQAYDAIAAGQHVALPEQTLQYADVAVAEVERLMSEHAEPLFEFWTKTLTSPLPILDFPLAQSPFEPRSATKAIETMKLPATVVAGLANVAKARGTTMFAVTAAVYASLLARYGRGGDVLFGCPVANRSAETAQVVGPFAGPMAIRLDLSGDPTLHQVVERTHNYLLDALSAADLPFDQITSRIDTHAVAGRNPLFQFYFVYQQAFLQKQSIAALTIEPMQSLPTGTPFELQLVLVNRDGDVTAQVDYDPSLLSADTVKTVLQYYAMTAAAMASTGASQTLSMLPEPGLGTAQRYGIAAPATAFEAPRTPTEVKLAAIWEGLLKRGKVGVNDDFFALGGQSILAARLVLAVQQKFGIDIQVSTVARARTIALMARLLEDPEARVSRLIPMRTSGAGVPLFVVHCGGGHVLRYETLVEQLDHNYPVYGIAAPPINAGDPSVTVESLASLYIEDIRKVQPHGPYRLAGYSFGGLVAYEMARQLSLSGETTELLAILDTINRAHYAGLPVRTKVEMAKHYLADRGGRHLARLQREGATAFTREAVAATMRKLRPRANKIVQKFSNGAHPRLSTADATDTVPDNANLTIFTELAARYRPKPYAGRVTVVHAMERGREYADNPTLGWETLAAFGADSILIPGDHMTFMRPPHVGHLAAELSRRLSKDSHDR